MNFFVRAALPMIGVPLVLCVLVMFSPTLAAQISALSVWEMTGWIVALIVFSLIEAMLTGGSGRD